MKKILLGITGGIAAYKTPDLIRQLVAKDYDVKVVITQNAKEFVSILTLKTLLPSAVFETLIEPDMQHIQLAKWADIILIAPATANMIAKINYGLADDLLSTVCLASKAKIIIAPAMNQMMWQHSSTQQNVSALAKRGVVFLGPAEGMQACGDCGPGRMLEPSDIVCNLMAHTNLYLKNIRILITAGATREPIDPVRYISNRSSGKMGYALANAAKNAGATVTLISGEASILAPMCDTFVKVITAHDMYVAVQDHIADQDIFISVAAISDFTVENISPTKIKRGKESMVLKLIPTMDILSEISKKEERPYIVGFAAETNDVLENAKAKRIRKGIEMIIANDVSQSDIGFESNENAVTVITENEIIRIEKNSKDILAQKLLHIIAEFSSLALKASA